jgi:hypothetical protein
MIRPEWARLGTVTINPALAARSRAAGELRLTRAPGPLGNATSIPGFSPIPPTSRVPRVETWWGLALHLAAGTQRTLVIRIVVTCLLAARRRAARRPLAPPEPDEGVPPEEAGLVGVPAAAPPVKAPRSVR